MGLQRQIVGAGEIAATDEKLIAAMDRNGWRDRRADPIAVERPVGVKLFGCICCRLVGRELERDDIGAQRIRYGVDQTGISLVERV
jgi:hypothetical protein